jgi:hypothetical protein
MVCYDAPVRNSLGDLVRFTYIRMDDAFMESQYFGTFGVSGKEFVGN